MNKICNKFGLRIMGVLAAVGSFIGLGSSVHAAADATLTTNLASSTETINDNAPVIMNFFTSTWGKALLISILLASLGLALIMIRGAIIRRRARR